MTDLTTAFPCKHCGAQIAAPAELTTTKVACGHCGSEQLVPDAAKRLAFADKLANRRAEDRASRRFDLWMYLVIGAFVAALLGYIGWVVYRQMHAAVDPAVTESDLASWVAKQRECRTLVEPETMSGRARIELAATRCIRARAQTESSVFSLTATLLTKSRATVAGPTTGHVVDLHYCADSPQHVTLAIDIDALRYAVAAVDCARE